VASGLSLSGWLGAPLVAAWRGCDPAGTCSAQASVGAVSRHSRAPAFGTARTLGRIDPSEVPATSASGRGALFVGWIGNGRVQAVRTASGRFGSAATITRSGYASGLALAGSGSSGALASWIEGTARERVRVSGWSGR
jgi:hypothetical protein